MIDGGKHIPDHFDQAAAFEPNAIPQARGSECDEPVWMEWTPRLPGVRAWGIPRASSTPRPCERQVSRGPLLASAPGGLPPVNDTGTPLQAVQCRPLPPQDEASTLANGARARLHGRPRVSAPAEDHSAGW